MRGFIGYVCLAASVLAGIITLWLHSWVPFIEPSLQTNAATFSWITGISAFGFFVLFLPRRREPGPAMSVSEKWTFMAAIAAAFLLRMYKVTHQGINSDEWYWLMQAREILSGRLLSPFSFIGDQPSNLPVYPVAVALFATANNYLAARIPGILYSLGTMSFVYFLLREAVSKNAATAGLILLLTSVWDIHNSQIGLQNVTINPFLISGFMYFLHSGYVRRSFRRMFVAGLFLGLSINLLYVSALSLATFVVYGIAVTVRNPGIAVRLMLVAVLSCVLTILPTIPKILRYPERSIGRHEKFTAENVEHSVTEGKPLPEYYGEQAVLLIRDFAFRPGGYGVSYLWGITLEPPVTALVAVGAMFVIIRLFRPFELMLGMQFLMMSVPVVVLYRATSIWREYAFVPVIYVIAGIGYENVDRFIRRFLKRFRDSFLKMLPFVFLAVYVFSLAYAFRLYNAQYLAEEPFAYETHCKHVSELVPGIVSGGETIFLPAELCGGYIALFLPASIRPETYENAGSLRERIRGSLPAVIVKLEPYAAMSDAQRGETVSDFLSGLGASYDLSEIRYTTGSDGTIEAVVVTIR